MARGKRKALITVQHIRHHSFSLTQSSHNMQNSNFLMWKNKNIGFNAILKTEPFGKDECGT